MIIALVPASKSEQELALVGGLSGAPRIAGRVAEFAHVRESNVRSKFVPDFVVQTNSGIDVGEARSNLKGSIVVAVDVELRLGLQDPFLCEQ